MVEHQDADDLGAYFRSLFPTPQHAQLWINRFMNSVRPIAERDETAALIDKETIKPLWDPPIGFLDRRVGHSKYKFLAARWVLREDAHGPNELGLDEALFFFADLQFESALKGYERWIEQETAAYRKKYKEHDYHRDQVAAAQGDREAQLRLIEFDKVFLLRGYTQKSIQEAVQNEDQEFLKKVGQAMARLPHYIKKVKAKDRAIRDFLQEPAKFGAWHMPKYRELLRKNLAEAASKSGDESLIDLVGDPVYFRTWLKRQGFLH